MENYEKNLENLTKEIDENPSSFEAYISRGNLHMKNKFYQKAILDFTKALKYTSNLNVYLYRSNANRKLKNYEKAIEDCNFVIKSIPNNYLGYFTRGNIHFEKENYKNAVSDYTKSLNFKSDNKNIYKNRAIAFKSLKMEKEYRKDLDMYKKLNEIR